ncbi:MAG: hypothetical protein RR198_06720 [Oscillospiraceae bacterium]
MSNAHKKTELAKVKKAATNVGLVALHGYRAFLKAKIVATDVALLSIEGIKKNQNNKPNYAPKEKEDDTMKSFVSALAVLAVTGAAIGAAGYYLYKKEKELNEYEDLLFNDEYMHEYPQTEEEKPSEADVCGEDCHCQAEKAEQAAKDIDIKID